MSCELCGARLNVVRCGCFDVSRPLSRRLSEHIALTPEDEQEHRLLLRRIYKFFSAGGLPALLFSRSHWRPSRGNSIRTTHHVFAYAELYSYLRSPYRDLSAYDNNAQVRVSLLIRLRRCHVHHGIIV